MPPRLTNTPKFDLKVATAEVQDTVQEKKRGVLFFVLPPLLVLSIFVYCAIKTPKKTAFPESSTVQKVHYSTTAQPMSDDEADEEEEEEADE